MIAYAAPYEYSDVSEILVLAEERGEEPFIVILDGIEDPHNLGAVLRSAEGAGVHGVIIARNRAAALTDAAVKVSAGAAEYMLLSRVTNLARTVDELKKKGVWIWGCDVSGSEYGSSDMTGPVALVIGNEGRGISRLLGEKCDFMVSIPMRGKINSLNASNAAAVLMWEAGFAVPAVAHTCTPCSECETRHVNTAMALPPSVWGLSLLYTRTRDLD